MTEIAENDPIKEKEKAPNNGDPNQFKVPQQSKQKYGQICESANDAIIIMKHDKFIDCNQKALELFECTRSDIIGKSVHNFSPKKQPDGRDSKTKGLEKIAAVNQDVPQLFEWLYISKNGNQFDAEIHLNKFYQGDNDFIIAVIRNISKRKLAEDDLRASKQQLEAQNEQLIATEQQLLAEIEVRKDFEKALKESEERLDLAMSVANDGIWDWNLTSDSVYFDERYYTIAGYEVNAFPQTLKEFQKRVHPDDLDHVKSQADKYLKGAIDTFDVEFRFAHANQNWIWIRSRGKIVEHDNDGVPTRFVGTHADITARKAAEESLSNMQKLESLGILAGGIAHDFNNLMQSIFGYIDLAISQTKEDRVVKFLNEAMNSIERASDLTGQLLTFAKGGSPVKKLAPLSPFIQKTVKFALSGSNISCRFSIPDNLPACEYDENQMAQVIDNIVINAKQAMPGTGSLNISAQEITFRGNEHISLSPGTLIKVAFRDQGIGMPKEIQSKIFDPFFSTKPEGHGLGLSTCYSIIKRHGGIIEVDSEPGKGSEFTIFLPTTSGDPSIKEKTEEVKHTGKGVMIVMDDEETIRQVAKQMLENFGYTVVLKTNGKEVLEYISNVDDDIAGIILDLTIPGGMGGQETVIEIKKMRPETPVFISSGYVYNPIMVNASKYGFTASIAKPFTHSRLAKVLNQFIGKDK